MQTVDVVRCIQALQTEPQRIQETTRFLQEFQGSPEAWGVLREILDNIQNHRPDVLEFSFQTVVLKLKDGKLPDPNFLEYLLTLIRNRRSSLSRSAFRQLCLAVCDCVLISDSKNGDVLTLLQQLSAQCSPTGEPEFQTFAELAIMLVEETGNKRLNISNKRRKEISTGFTHNLKATYRLFDAIVGENETHLAAACKVMASWLQQVIPLMETVGGDTARPTIEGTGLVNSLASSCFFLKVLDVLKNPSDPQVFLDVSLFLTEIQRLLWVLSLTTSTACKLLLNALEIGGTHLLGRGQLPVCVTFQLEPSNDGVYEGLSQYGGCIDLIDFKAIPGIPFQDDSSPVTQLTRIYTTILVKFGNLIGSILHDASNPTNTRRKEDLDSLCSVFTIALHLVATNIQAIHVYAFEFWNNLMLDFNKAWQSRPHALDEDDLDGEDPLTGLYFDMGDREYSYKADDVAARKYRLEPLFKAFLIAVTHGCCRYPAEPENELMFDLCELMEFRETIALVVTEVCSVVPTLWTIEHIGSIYQGLDNPPWNVMESCIFMLTTVTQRAKCARDNVIPDLVGKVPNLQFAHTGSASFLLRGAVARLIHFTAVYIAGKPELYQRILHFLAFRLIPSIPHLDVSQVSNGPQVLLQMEDWACKALRMIQRSGEDFPHVGLMFEQMSGRLLTLVQEENFLDVGNRIVLAETLGIMISHVRDQQQVANYFEAFLKTLVNKAYEDPSDANLSIFMAGMSSVYPGDRGMTTYQDPQHTPVLTVIATLWPYISQVVKVNHANEEFFSLYVRNMPSIFNAYHRSALRHPCFELAIRLNGELFQESPSHYHVGFTYQVIMLFFAMNSHDDPAFKEVFHQIDVFLGYLNSMMENGNLQEVVTKNYMLIRSVSELCQELLKSFSGDVLLKYPSYVLFIRYVWQLLSVMRDPQYQVLLNSLIRLLNHMLVCLPQDDDPNSRTDLMTRVLFLTPNLQIFQPNPDCVAILAQLLLTKMPNIRSPLSEMFLTLLNIGGCFEEVTFSVLAQVLGPVCTETEFNRFLEGLKENMMTQDDGQKSRAFQKLFATFEVSLT